jgi:hypothetical protein
LHTGTDRTATLHFLQPATTYTVNVLGSDYGNNVSPLSNSLTVTTAVTNPNDVTPPPTPANLTQDNWCDEVHLTWVQSTDDFDAQSAIRYDLYVNGVLSDTLFGSGGPSIVYGTPEQLNTFEVIASDTAGNESNAGTLSVLLCSRP